MEPCNMLYSQSKLKILIGYANYAAGAAIVAMMILTCVDIVLRFIGSPIRGVFDLIGFLGSLSVSFALAYASMENGHVAVEILMESLPQRIQFRILAFGGLLSTIFFAFLTWQSFLYATELYQSGEVSMTVGMPIHPFVLGAAAGSALLSLVLAVDCVIFTKRGFGR
jgi:TRAP-type C4-dicarboxylate transport system permease small subunit